MQQLMEHLKDQQLMDWVTEILAAPSSQNLSHLMYLVLFLSAPSETHSSRPFLSVVRLDVAAQGPMRARLPVCKAHQSQGQAVASYCLSFMKRLQ